MKWEENVRKVVPYVEHSDYIRIQMPSRWWMPWQHIMM